MCDPLVISWPAGMSARGEVRDQYHHCTDIVPTILDCCGVEMPAVVDGYEQTPLPGVSMRYSFDAADAPTQKETQYYEMLGTRGIWHQGWKAVTEHGPVPIGLGNFDNDRWQLFHTDEDRAEAHDVAEENPEKVQELKDLWLEEAKKYDVLPLNDLSILEYRDLEFEIAVPESGQYTYYPGTAAIPQASSANTINVSYKILAEVDFTRESEGVIVAQGSRFGGYTLFVKDGKLTYVYNFLGIPPEQTLAVDAPSPGSHIVGVEFTKEQRGRASRADRNAEAAHRRSSRRGDGDPYDGVAVQPLRRRTLRRLRRRRRRQPAVPAEVRLHRGPGRQGRVRRRRRRLPRRRAAPRRGDGARLSGHSVSGRARVSLSATARAQITD